MESKLDKKVELDEVKALIEENKESAATCGNDQDGTLTSQLEEFWLHSLSSVYLYQLFYIVHLLLLYLLLFSLLVQFSSTLRL
jgi:hypothetical protein